MTNEQLIAIEMKPLEGCAAVLVSFNRPFTHVEMNAMHRALNEHLIPHDNEPFEQRLRTPQGEPALTHVDGLPGTREPVSQQPQGNAGESPALFNCGYDPTSHGWVIREGSREGVLVACFLREEDANGYVIPARALRSQAASRDASSVPMELYSRCTGAPHDCPYIYCHSQLKCARQSE